MSGLQAAKKQQARYEIYFIKVLHLVKFLITSDKLMIHPGYTR